MPVIIKCSSDNIHVSYQETGIRVIFFPLMNPRVCLGQNYADVFHLEALWEHCVVRPGQLIMSLFR